MKQRIQGIIIGFLISALLFSTVVVAAPATMWKKIDVAYGDYKIVIDGVPFEAKDKNGVIESFSYNGWIYAPFEHIARALGKTASWDVETHTLYLGKKIATGQTIKLSSLNYLTRNPSWQEWKQQEARSNTDEYYNDCLVINCEYFAGAVKTQDYFLDSKYTKITGKFFAAYGSRSDNSKHTFKIYGDNKLLYSSEDISGGTLPRSFDVNISGVSIFRLSIEKVTGSSYFDFVIADAMLYK